MKIYVSKYMCRKASADILKNGLTVQRTWCNTLAMCRAVVKNGWRSAGRINTTVLQGSSVKPG
jgi:hypothetical protein